MFTSVLLLLILLQSALSLPNVITLGGIFDDDELEQEIIFELAAELINEDYNMLPGSVLNVHKISGRLNDTFQLTKKVCKSLYTHNIAVIFGPQSSVSATHIQSICDVMEVPHIETRWDYKLSSIDLSINLHPDIEDLTLHYISLVKYYNWTSFIIIYEENDGLIRLQDFFRESSKYKWNIQLYQFVPSIPYRELFRDIRISFKKKLKEDICILLDVPTKKIYEVFKMAQQVEMMTVRNKYIVTSLDLHTVNLDEFRYSRTNITGFRLTRKKRDDETFGRPPECPNSPDYQSVLDEVQLRLRRRKANVIPDLSTASALIYDAVYLFARALEQLDNSKHVTEFPRLDCSSLDSKGTDGTSLINYMKTHFTYCDGLTGKIRFDPYGFRSGFTLDIMQLSRESGLEKIGNITSNFDGDIRNINVTITEVISLDDPVTGLENQKYIITTIQQDPFVMLTKSLNQLSGNDRYEGYVIDLVHHLSEYLHFTYEIKLVKDNAHGVEENGTWIGMIGEVVRGEADMAIADISVNSARAKVVEFTLPFMTTGISILYKKPTQKTSSLFSFMAPFSADVWIYGLIAYLAISIVLFLVGRLSPYEWANINTCRQNENIEENYFTLGNSMWFLLAAFMQAGSEIEPRAMSTRTISGSWYFFTLIIISSYTAKMASFLTVEKVMYPISSVNDLAKQTEIKYGCMRKGSTLEFFKNSNDDVYKHMWNVMSSDRSRLVESNKKGVNRVLIEDYALFMESASIQYHIHKQCNLTQIGGLLDSKGYGIAVKKGNTALSNWLSRGILHLEEEGMLNVLRERWWKYKRQTGSCENRVSSMVKELELNNVGGVFLVMMAGVLIGIVVAPLEFLWKFQKHASWKDLIKMMAKEIKFALACSSPTKEVPRPSKKVQKSHSRIIDSIGSKFGLYKQ